MAAPKDRTYNDDSADRQAYGPTFDVPVYRKQLVGTANSDNLLNAFEVIVGELMGNAVIGTSLRTSAQRDTFEFVAHGHTFTVDVRPSDETA